MRYIIREVDIVGTLRLIYSVKTVTERSAALKLSHSAGLHLFQPAYPVCGDEAKEDEAKRSVRTEQQTPHDAKCVRIM